MKVIVLVLTALVSLSPESARAEPAPLKVVVAGLPATIPATPIRRVTIVPFERSADGGDILVEYADGTGYRIRTFGRARAPQLAPDGQTFGFNLVSRYIDTSGNPWITTNGVVFYRQGRRLPSIEPVKQATVGWAFRAGSSRIMLSAAGTHGMTYLSLWDLASGKQVAEAADYAEVKPGWTAGPSLVFCCSVEQ